MLRIWGARNCQWSSVAFRGQIIETETGDGLETEAEIEIVEDEVIVLLIEADVAQDHALETEGVAETVITAETETCGLPLRKTTLGGETSPHHRADLTLMVCRYPHVHLISPVTPQGAQCHPLAHDQGPGCLIPPFLYPQTEEFHHHLEGEATEMTYHHLG